MGDRILLVEDDPLVREAATAALEDAGFEVRPAADGDSAMGELRGGSPFDLVVLDVMLPDANGFDLCRRVRAESGTPVVMLTARADTVDIVTGLELGADDYLTKPFESAELVARIRAVLRRSKATAEGDVVSCRDVTADAAAFRAHKGGDELPLTTMELRLLIALVRDAGRVLSREALLERVWGYEYLGDSRLVDMAVKRLRDKLGDPPSPPAYISTVRGVGYRFEPG